MRSLCRTNGNAVVNAFPNPWQTNTLNLGAGITASDVTLQANDATGNLTVTLDTGDSITFDGILSGGYYGLNSTLTSIHFDDGSSMTLNGASYSNMTYTYTGTSTNTTLTGSNLGNDVFNFGAGGDSITAGSRNNTYNYGSGDGQATINATSSYGTNTLNFGGALSDQDLWFQRSGNNLVIDVVGSSDQVTVTNWYTNGYLSEIKAGGLEIDSQLNQLVQAMATFEANNSGFNPATATAMPTDSTLQSTLAASWHG